MREFRHEGCDQALLERDLLGACLEDHVPVGGDHRIGIFEIGLDLARRIFGFDHLDGHAGCFHVPTQGAEICLVLRSADQCLRMERPMLRRQVHETLVEGRHRRLVEQVAFELGGKERPQPMSVQPLDHAGKDRAGRDRDRLALRGHGITHDEGGLLEPGITAQGSKVRAHDEVRIAVLPAGKLVARVECVVMSPAEHHRAGSDAVAPCTQEMPGGQPLADKAALHVRHSDDDGLDVARRDQGPQFLELHCFSALALV